MTANTYYAGAASGGIWRTEDAGLNWEPVFDDQPVHSIGALAVAPSDHAIVWAGTGESSIRSNVSIGNGVWKSTDGGDTWAHMGLEGTGRVGRILIHPADPDVVYVAALGHSYQPAEERGVYRTLDGGESWERVLFVDPGAGAYEMVMDPGNPRKIMATMWDLDLKTWKRDSGGTGQRHPRNPGRGRHLARDRGQRPPHAPHRQDRALHVGVRLGPHLRPHRDRRRRARSTAKRPTAGNCGARATAATAGVSSHISHDLASRQAYYTRCGVAPDDRDEVYFLSSSYSVSLNGGETHETTNFLRAGDAPGWDHHDIWSDPLNADRIAVAHDGGFSISENRGRSWFRVQLPIAQMYHVTADNAVPYNVLGNRQDGPSFRGPSNSRMGGLFSNGRIPRGRVARRGRRREWVRDARPA